MSITLALSGTSAAQAQTEDLLAAPEETPDDEQAAPERVEVRPVAEDEEIAARIERILNATEWYINPKAHVEEGVVFLSGQAKSQERKDWANKLASNTRDVVAVANRMEVVNLAPDFAPAREEIRVLRRNAIQALPSLLIGLVLLIVFWLAAKLAALLARRVAARRTSNSLLKEVVAKAFAIPVALLGIYLALRVSGLTRLAATVLGGTGLLGLFLGIAFRDIAENFLASILLSIQRPFQTGDLIVVEAHQGFVQSVTTRGTTIMTVDGDHVQIPNSTIYKSVIRNITANPYQRQTFVVGVGYEDSLEEVQTLVLAVLKEHRAVLADPEPLVLVDELASATVNMRIYFWLDIVKHSGLKVRSSLIRLVRNALIEHGFTLPDEAREVIFPKGVPVRMIEAAHEASNGSAVQPARPTHAGKSDVSTQAEGELVSEAGKIKEQARRSRKPEQGENLLD